MARGDNPERTPLYGGLLIVAAMLVGLAVTKWSTPVPLRVLVYLICLVAASAGALMTLRDRC